MKKQTYKFKSKGKKNKVFVSHTTEDYIKICVELVQIGWKIDDEKINSSREKGKEYEELILEANGQNHI